MYVRTYGVRTTRASDRGTAMSAGRWESQAEEEDEEEEDGVEQKKRGSTFLLCFKSARGKGRSACAVLTSWAWIEGRSLMC